MNRRLLLLSVTYQDRSAFTLWMLRCLTSSHVGWIIWTFLTRVFVHLWLDHPKWILTGILVGILVYRGIFNMSENRKFESAHRFQISWVFRLNWSALSVEICKFSVRVHVLSMSFIYREGFGELPLLPFPYTIFDHCAAFFFFFLTRDVKSFTL